METMVGREGPRAELTGRRVGSPIIAATVTLLVLTGCGRIAPTAVSSVSASSSPSTSPSVPSPSPSDSASSPSSPSLSPTPTDGPGVKGTGTLKLFAVASRKLVGTCSEPGGFPVVTLADHKNDFFGTVDVQLTLDSERTSVSLLTVDLGEDSELITRQLSYDATQRAAGTSAALTVKGGTFRVVGKLASKEDGKDAGTMPVDLTVVCAGTDW